MEIKVMTNILDENDQLAESLAERFADQGIFVINLMGSPGCGKTSLLERTVSALKGKIRMAVIEGDLYTAKDAERIERQGVPVVQINTGGGCHLDANMVFKALDSLDLAGLDLIVIENVGNLVCPAEFELGEDVKVTVLSVTEGEDKPLKYPLMFRKSSVVVINKIDLLPYIEYDYQAVVRDITGINPGIKIIDASCRTGQGLDEWQEWLIRQIHNKKSS